MSWLFRFLAIFVVWISLASGEPRSLTKQDIKPILAEMLYYHVDYKQLTPQIIDRSFRVFFDQFDSNKVYLLEGEVNQFLNITDQDRMQVVRHMIQDNYNIYQDMLEICQKAVLRERSIRQEEIKKLLSEKGFQVTIDKLSFTDYNDYASSVDQLRSRVREKLECQISVEAVDQGLTTLNETQLSRQITLLDQRDRRYENIFLFQNSQGKACNKEKQENVTCTLILKSFARSLDAHTAFFSPEEATSMRASLQKQFKGIGVVIKEGLEGSYISDLIPNGPAAKSHAIQKGDILVQINGKNVQNAPFDEVLDAISSKGNSKVKLVLQRKKEQSSPQTVHVSLKKEVIVMENDRLSFTTEVVEGGVIGKINLTSFYDNGDGITVEKDLREAILKIKEQGELKGLIIDMRNNSGGFLTQAVKVSGLFIPKGIIVISKYSNGEIQYSRDLDGRLYFDGPLVVLTSKASASAAEVVAQALQDYGVALIAGDRRTYGKGSMQIQNITDEDAEAFFKVTVGRYYTISGRSTQIDGVLADIVVPTKYAPFDIGEKYLMYPLSRDNLGFSFLDQENLMKQYPQKDLHQMFSSYFPKQEQKWRKMLPELQAYSTARIQNNEDYQFFLKEAECIKNGSPSSEKAMSCRDLQMEESVLIVRDMINLNKAIPSP